MNDTWLFTSLCFFVLAGCAAVRIIPGPTLFDRLIAARTAVTIAVIGGLSAGIAYGSFFLLELVIASAVVGYAVIGLRAATYLGVQV
ncbi:MAG: hypothetical protein METHP_02104 [Methanoregula sp. SKADARSKE-2]|nr:MAG: hypothetical protein METHP_02104 [Methanoregula sp. SKADARSKE-2]